VAAGPALIQVTAAAQNQLFLLSFSVVSSLLIGCVVCGQALPRGCACPHSPHVIDPHTDMGDRPKTVAEAQAMFPAQRSFHDLEKQTEEHLISAELARWEANGIYYPEWYAYYTVKTPGCCGLHNAAKGGQPRCTKKDCKYKHICTICLKPDHSAFQRNSKGISSCLLLAQFEREQVQLTKLGFESYSELVSSFKATNPSAKAEAKAEAKEDTEHSFSIATILTPQPASVPPQPPVTSPVKAVVPATSAQQVVSVNPLTVLKTVADAKARFPSLRDLNELMELAKPSEVARYQTHWESKSISVPS
jgi:hypothetical protein